MEQAAVAVITYNSEREIERCLDSVARQRADVLVIDNGSTDRTVELVRARRVPLIENPWNRGFAAAVNQAFDILADARFLLLLNPDAELTTGLEPLLDACRAEGVAAAGGKLVDAAGRPQRGFMVRDFPSAVSTSFEAMGLNRLWPGNPVNRRYRCLDLDPERAAEVHQPAGAFLMIKRDAWRALGGFDERYFPVWFEDVDFLQRASGAGYRIYYVPDAAARHTGGHSVRALSWEKREFYWYDNLLKYARKHFASSSRRGLYGALIVGFFSRAVLGVISSRSLRPLSVYGRAIRLAGSCLRVG